MDMRISRPAGPWGWSDSPRGPGDCGRGPAARGSVHVKRDPALQSLWTLGELKHHDFRRPPALLQGPWNFEIDCRLVGPVCL